MNAQACMRNHARTSMHAQACTHKHARTSMHAQACTHNNVHASMHVQAESAGVIDIIVYFDLYGRRALKAPHSVTMRDVWFYINFVRVSFIVRRSMGIIFQRVFFQKRKESVRLFRDPWHQIWDVFFAFFATFLSQNIFEIKDCKFCKFVNVLLTV